ncbi:MAG TPA: bifunctional UDP-N-acetylglucosamine diphosphorylase/glucosamine-1-phosphate N-acetyltransferase GlmU [Coriobacteriia bacterium]
MKQAAAIVLAAGEGTRMRSSLPKVAHEILGVPLVRYVIDAARDAGVARIVTVVGARADAVGALASDTEIAVQAERLGTGHAVASARAALEGFAGPVLVLAGDVPLLRAETLARLLEVQAGTGAACVVLTARFPDPTGYGRVIRGEGGQVTGIVEQRDLGEANLSCGECNAGVYCFDAERMFSALERVTPHNAQGEYYLTDTIAILRSDGLAVDTVALENADEAHGINTRVQLAHAARLMQHRINVGHMLAGVTMTDPSLVWIGPNVVLGRDVVIEPMSELIGATEVADGARIGPSTRMRDSYVGAGAVVEQSIVREARIGERASVGPNAYLRPGTVLGAGSKAGSFVEVKNSTIGEGSKVPHLSYVGDATLGTGVNVGAGSITCNYDGHAKNRTVIGDDAFIGSATMLVAPVEIGEGAMTAAGSAISKDVPAGALGIERAQQRNIEGWRARRNAETGE